MKHQKKNKLQLTKSTNNIKPKLPKNINNVNN